MASYIVLEPTDAVKLKPVKAVAGDHTIFVRDEFTVFALILPFLWLLTHRLWWHALMVALIGWGAFSVLGSYLSSALVVSGLSFLLSLFVALEGRNWYLTALRRKGYEEVALISANDLSDAETHYFYGASKPAERAEPQAVVSDKVALKSTMTGNAAPATGAMIGLVDYHGRS
ncbi:DUF2628 domain-containing protein [Pseudochrobactrum sp. sp1633]|uniref:DUF2628 domain-containing protein n=1 Tax=Pseudochrobactrum sp. sp1633 TaxID=3036706 RepID=UPI0025A6520D|nr:DUF2628 domain-containing protein [Pseudochrobactrum sp. sp1633]MDM8344977.1 DUF2628 domain-containing protein [Pseudochrobactrum sp. sp1633]HWD14809.1 DUF2628 domain-containing protein [Pseudochrobactrum sp.]